MWFFKSPEIVFGAEALGYLERLEGKRAFIVTDAVIAKLGHVERVKKALEAVGFEVAIFDRVEPDPSLGDGPGRCGRNDRLRTGLDRGPRWRLVPGCRQGDVGPL